jgi:hypothetical protein
MRKLLELFHSTNDYHIKDIYDKSDTGLDPGIGSDVFGKSRFLNVESEEFRSSERYLPDLYGKEFRFRTVDKQSNWPQVWQSNATVQELELEKITMPNINNFRVYVNANDYFLSKLPDIDISV